MVLGAFDRSIVVLLAGAVLLPALSVAGDAPERLVPTKAKILVERPVESPVNFGQLQVGAKITRKFVLESTDGKPFDLNRAFTRKQTILVFFRGSW